MDDYNSNRLVIDEDSECYDQRRHKTSEAREDSGNQQNMEDFDKDDSVIDYNSEDRSVFERNMANDKQRPPNSPPQKKLRQVPEVVISRREVIEKEEQAIDQSGENAPLSPTEVDLTYLAPVRVEETADWPEPIRMLNVWLIRNDNFDGEWKEKMKDHDYYKSNDHFVWTNQLVVGRGVELDEEENLFSGELLNKVNNNPEIQRFPENTFSLKKTKDFGYGLFAKCFIENGSFKIIFVVKNV